MRDSPLADLEVKVQSKGSLAVSNAMEQEHRHSENLVPKREVSGKVSRDWWKAITYRVWERSFRKGANFLATNFSGAQFARETRES